MASLYKRKNGCFEISFIHPRLPKNANRKTVRLGKLRDDSDKAETAARDILKHVNELIDAMIADDRPREDTRKWLDRIRKKDATLYRKLVKKDLVQRSQKGSESHTLGPYLESYIAGRTDAKESSRILYRQTAEKLISHLSADISLSDINAGHGESFRIYLASQKIEPATVAKHIGITKTFFNSAIDREIIKANPFRKQKSSIQPNPERQYFITKDVAYRVLADGCPDAEYRLMFALARFGGLRCVSEIMAIKWSCIDWQNNRIKVISPKTERFPAGKSRIIPLFPELYPYLSDAFELAQDGAEYVIATHRVVASTLHSRFIKFIERAGLERWPKLFQNLRSSRQTELERIPGLAQHVVCGWMGNTPKVANKHYLQITDDDFALVTQGATQSASAHACKGVHSRQEHKPETPVSLPCMPVHTDANPTDRLLLTREA